MGTQELTNNSMVNDLIQDAVLKICTEHMAFTRILEVDGIVCISPENSCDVVVKIHRTIVKPQDPAPPSPEPRPLYDTPPVRLQPQTIHQPSQPISDLEVMKPQPQPENTMSPHILEVHSLQNKPVQVDQMMPASVQTVQDNSFIDFEVTQNSPEQEEIIKEPEFIYYDEEGEVKFNSDNETNDDSMMSTESPFNVKSLIGTSSRDVKDLPYSCPVCKEIYQELDKLEEHMPVHGDFEKFQCENCRRYFQRKSSLTLHLNKMTCRNDGMVIECNMCSRQFMNRDAFKLHMRKHYENNQNKKRNRLSGKNIQCLRCDVICTSVKDYEQHMKIHPVSKPYSCKLCNKGFQSKGGLDMHMKRHRGEDPYESHKKVACEFCDRVCISKSALAIHMRMHTGEKPFKCRVHGCEKDFKHKYDYQIHVQRNHDNGPFELLGEGQENMEEQLHDQSGSLLSLSSLENEIQHNQNNMDEDSHLGQESLIINLDDDDQMTINESQNMVQ